MPPTAHLALKKIKQIREFPCAQDIPIAVTEVTYIRDFIIMVRGFVCS